MVMNDGTADAPGLRRVHDGEEATGGPIFLQASDGDEDLPEPIAIIGMACRLPGGSSSTSQLWDQLIEGHSGHCNIPASRFNASGFFHPDESHPGSINDTGGYFIDEDIRLFENSFFGINNLEAKYMDPQQRKLLEAVYECFESAGVPLHEISGANIGCYIANFTADFLIMQSKDPEYFHHYSATGNGPTILANRISHVFNLSGPSLVLDTACSSSLYSLHVACAALHAKDCDAAIVAGANLIQSPELHLAAVKAGILSGTSTCHTFDAAADGYGRADGVGALLIKRLSDAIRDKDPVRSVIRGTAVNSNGKTNGITLPSADGQEAVIRKAYAMAGLPLDETDYVEAHGTGTPVGDPIEIEAIARVFRHKSGSRTLVGSVKTNLGHSEAVSGISSVIKVALALERGLIPPSIGVQNVNPDLKLEERNVEIVTDPTPWPQTSVPRASINSFGYGGANAHAILEAASCHVPKSRETDLIRTTSNRNTFLLPFSAHSRPSLISNVEGLAPLDLGCASLMDLAFTLGNRRSRLPTRGFLLAHCAELHDDLVSRKLRMLEPGSHPSILPFAFIFTGQGAQWPGMGRQLINEFPTYSCIINDLDSVLLHLPHSPSWNIRDAIFESDEKSSINQASRSQTVCTATQIALVELLKEWGVVPEAVIGHSSGEIAAAFTAGHLSAAEAIKVAYYRGLTVSKCTSEGAMVATSLDGDSALKEISRLGLRDKIRVACLNSSESTTLSGDSEAVEQIFAEFQDRKEFARKLKTGGKAYHSHHMSSVGKEYEDLLSTSQLEYKSDPLKSRHIRFMSSTMRQFVEPKVTCSPSYWRKNLESPVFFRDAIHELLTDHEYHMIEIGPHPILELPVKQARKELNVSETQLRYSPTLLRGKDSVDAMLSLVGTLFLQGYELDFQRINHLPEPPITSPSLTVDCKVLHNLPRYRWNYDSPLESESRLSSEFRNRKYPRHDLLGSRIPGGSGEIFSWRNIITVRDVPWLADHRLGQRIVLPGACYLAMAIEGLTQLHPRSRSENLRLSLKQVTFITALELPENGDGTELFTLIRPSRVSATMSSSKWWEFETSSFHQDTSTVHSRGLIGYEPGMLPALREMSICANEEESRSTRAWYDKMAREGLNFGPSFQSLTEIITPRTRKVHQIISKTESFSVEKSGIKQESSYLLHPITIDAVLQTALVATSGGLFQDFRGKVPVSINNIQIMFDKSPIARGSCSINAVSEAIGFGMAKANAELINPEGETLMHIGQVKFAPYHGLSERDEDIGNRYPILKVHWKPDISRLSPSVVTAFTKYTDMYASSTSQEFEEFDHGRFAGAVDLLVHERSSLRILEVGNHDDKLTLGLLKSLDADTSMKRFRSYTQASFSQDGDIVGRNITSISEIGNSHKTVSNLTEADVFDIVLFPAAGTQYAISGPSLTLRKPFINIANQIEELDGHVTQSTMFLFQGTCLEEPPFDPGQFQSLSTTPAESNSAIRIVARVPKASPETTRKRTEIILVNRTGTCPFSEYLGDVLSKSLNLVVSHMSLQQVCPTTIPSQSTIVSLIEIDQPILSLLNDSELASIRTLTTQASTLLWITGGGLYRTRKPDFALVLGLSRSVMLEQPSLKFVVLDIDDYRQNWDSTMSNISVLLDQAIADPEREFEYVQHEGALYTSRFVPEGSMNRCFQKRHRGELESMPLGEAETCQLSVKEFGQVDTIEFVQRSLSPEIPETGHLEVYVKCAGLNAKDLHILASRLDTKGTNCSLEFSGIVARVGPDVSTLVPGDRVVVMAPTCLATSVQVPEWACVKLREDEDFTTLSTVPLAFSTALYALKHRADLQRKESVLIHSATGGVGIAAIQVARLMDAEIYATVGTEEKKDFLTEKFGLNRDHIFSSRDQLFLPAVLAATSGRGVDVVINSLTNDLLHDSWQACAEFGRFIEIGKRDILDNGKLDLSVFERNVTFSAFDLTSLYYSERKTHQAIWTGLLRESIRLLRDGQIQPITPLKTFDVAEITQAFRYFSSPGRIGKVAVSFENPESRILVVPRKYKTTFSPNKTYLLVGCLGGLGRSLSKWMLYQGARKFVFLSRTGAERPAARRLVEDLEAAGGHIIISKASVTEYSDVLKAVAQIEGPIGGVVHAAMGLDEALFAEMSCASWHTSIGPKVKGTWNLHNALQAREEELDFFFMTSSISGSVGTATESNYCAANAFMDAFARYRRSLGRTALSLGLGMISEVGYLHEHPEIEALLLRKGIHPINEEELLLICDISLSDVSHNHRVELSDHFAKAHVLTGLEVLGLRDIRKQGFEGGSHVLDDPRATIIAEALLAADGNGAGTQVNASSSHSLPDAVAVALATSTDVGTVDATLVDAVQLVVVEKVGNLLLLPPENLTPQTRLSDFGLDSMLAAEFRQFVFRTFDVDVPFSTLLGDTTSVLDVTDSVAKGLLAASLNDRT